MAIEEELNKFVNKIADGKVLYSGQWNSCGQPFSYWEFNENGERRSISLERVPQEYQTREL